MAAVTSRLEDYLEALFFLETTGNRLTVTALAENLKLTKGTIATVVKKMAERELVWHEAYGAIRLTPKGRWIGWQVYMKHERLTSFFHDFLGQDEESSEEIACLIEHHLDGAAAAKFFNLVAFLQEAQSEQKEWTRELLRSLSQTGRLPAPLTLALGGQGRVCRLSGNGEIRRKLAEKGIRQGDFLEIASCHEAAGGYEVVKENRVIVLDFAEAASVWIV